MEIEDIKSHQIIPTSNRIKLDVGGKIFHVSKSTLLKQDSFFSSMFGGKFGEPKIESDGTYFIGKIYPTSPIRNFLFLMY